MGDIYTLFGEKETKINWVIVGPAGTEFCGVLLACQVQYEDQVVQVPVQKQVHVPMVQTVQKHIEIPQIEYQDEIVEVPVQWLANLLEICGEQIGWKLPQELK